jgi:hypothetical protein
MKLRRTHWVLERRRWRQIAKNYPGHASLEIPKWAKSMSRISTTKKGEISNRGSSKTRIKKAELLLTKMIIDICFERV